MAALSPVLLDSSVAQTVGTAGAVNPQAQVGARVLQVGSSIIFRERISTSASGSTQVMFVDKTTLSVGPNSNILIDEFVYNPNAGAGRMTVTLTKGAMRMVGGNVSHTEGVTIKTPLATIGVRGGVATVKHDARSGTQAINHFGTLMVTACQRPPGSNAQPPRTCTGASETVTRPGYGVSVKAAGTAPSPPAPVPQGEIAALTLQLTSQPTQTGGSDSPPSNSIAAALVGDTNVNLVPAQVQSVQGQTASQTAGSTQVQPVQTQSLTQVTQQSAQQASQQSAVPQVPLTAFYALSVVPDAGFGSGVPYLPAAFAVPGIYVVSDMLGYRRGGVDPATGQPQFGSVTLQAGLSINGAGASQTSTFFVTWGGFTRLADGTQVFNGGFDASTRRAANLSAGFAAGAVGNVANTTLNADGIPIGVVLDQNSRDPVTGAVLPNSAFYFPGGGGPSANYTFSQSASAIAPPPGIGQVRPDTTLSGFVGGLARTLHSPQQPPNDLNYTFAGPSFPIVGGITIQFDAARGRMQANGVLTKVDNFSGDIHEFSDAVWQIGNLNPSARARATYIDDRLFAGRQAVNEPFTSVLNTTEISSTDGQTLVRSRQAFASSDLVQAQTFFPGVSFSSCTCEFTRWGFWSADNYRSNPDLTTETDRAHLMTWVAGRVASPAEVPASGTAVYNGFVVGAFKNVSNEYVAAGNFQANVNFASGATVSIPSLDGRAYSGSITRFAGTNELIGTLSGTGGANMAINGAFFRGATDPVKDVAGRFSVTASPVGANFNYIGAGVFAGSR
jgi:hypothetical protein